MSKNILPEYITTAYSYSQPLYMHQHRFILQRERERERGREREGGREKGKEGEVLTRSLTPFMLLLVKWSMQSSSFTYSEIKFISLPPST